MVNVLPCEEQDFPHSTVNEQFSEEKMNYVEIKSRLGNVVKTASSLTIAIIYTSLKSMPFVVNALSSVFLPCPGLFADFPLQLSKVGQPQETGLGMVIAYASWSTHPLLVPIVPLAARFRAGANHVVRRCSLARLRWSRSSCKMWKISRHVDVPIPIFCGEGVKESNSTHEFISILTRAARCGGLSALLDT